MTAPSQTPDRVARFYGNVEFALDTNANRQLTFIHVSKLNDPFDPYFFFETQFDDKYDALISYVRTAHPNDFGWFIQNVPLERWNKTIDEIRTFLESMRQSTFLLSTSGLSAERHPRDDLHMWGHYGNGHRGVLIEFDTNELKKCAKTANDLADKKTNNVDQVFVKVEYRQKLRPLAAEDIFSFYKSDNLGKYRATTLEAYFKSTLGVKSTEWKHEDEWRMLWHNDETRLKVQRMKISEAAVKNVYIGFNATKTNSEDIVFETRRRFPNAQIVFARRASGTFGLEFSPA